MGFCQSTIGLRWVREGGLVEAGGGSSGVLQRLKERQRNLQNVSGSEWGREWAVDVSAKKRGVVEFGEQLVLGIHQNANAAWDIYCGVLTRFKTGSSSCEHIAKPLLGPNKSAIKSWCDLNSTRYSGNPETAASQTTAEKFMKMPCNDSWPRRDSSKRLLSVMPLWQTNTCKTEE